MTIDPDRRLAHTLANDSATIQRIADALENAKRGRITEALDYAIRGHHAGDIEIGEEAVALLLDAMSFLLALRTHAGGPAAGIHEIEPMLNPSFVAAAVLRQRDIFVDEMAEALRAGGWIRGHDGRWREP